jgi:hypothetical protein
MIMLQPGNTRWLHSDSAGPGIPVDPSVAPDWITRKEGEVKGQPWLAYLNTRPEVPRSWRVIDRKTSRMAWRKGRLNGRDGRQGQERCFDEAGSRPPFPNASQEKPQDPALAC